MKKNKSKLNNQISLKADIIINLIFIIFAVASIAPIFLVLGVSLTSQSELRLEGYKFIPHMPTLYAYKYIFNSVGSIFRAYGVSIFVTVVGTISSLLLIVSYAYPISRPDFKYRKIFSFFVFFTMIFHGGMIPTYIVMVRFLHLKNTVWAMIWPYLMGAWNVMIMRTFFSNSIPQSMIEAAKVDGAGEFRILCQLVMPLSLPGLATICMFVCILYWNDWQQPLLYITDKSLYNLQYTLYNLLANMQYLAENANEAGMQGLTAENLPSESARMAMCMIALGPIVLVYPFFQKYFIQGLTVGAVKG